MKLYGGKRGWLCGCEWGIAQIINSSRKETNVRSPDGFIPAPNQYCTITWQRGLWRRWMEPSVCSEVTVKHTNAVLFCILMKRCCSWLKSSEVHEKCSVRAVWCCIRQLWWISRSHGFLSIFDHFYLPLSQQPGSFLFLFFCAVSMHISLGNKEAVNMFSQRSVPHPRQSVTSMSPCFVLPYLLECWNTAG